VVAEWPSVLRLHLQEPHQSSVCILHMYRCCNRMGGAWEFNPVYYMGLQSLHAMTPLPEDSEAHMTGNITQVLQWSKASICSLFTTTSRYDAPSHPTLLTSQSVCQSQCHVQLLVTPCLMVLCRVPLPNFRQQGSPAEHSCQQGGQLQEETPQAAGQVPLAHPPPNKPPQEISAAAGPCS